MTITNVINCFTRFTHSSIYGVLFILIEALRAAIAKLSLFGFMVLFAMAFNTELLVALLVYLDVNLAVSLIEGVEALKGFTSAAGRASYGGYEHDKL